MIRMPISFGISSVRIYGGFDTIISYFPAMCANKSVCITVQSACNRSRFFFVRVIAASEISARSTDTAGTSFATLIPIQPLPQHISNTRNSLSPVCSRFFSLSFSSFSHACSTRSSVSGLGIRTSSAVANSYPINSCVPRIYWHGLCVIRSVTYACSLCACSSVTSSAIRRISVEYVQPATSIARSRISLSASGISACLRRSNSSFINACHVIVFLISRSLPVLRDMHASLKPPPPKRSQPQPYPPSAPWSSVSGSEVPAY